MDKLLKALIGVGVHALASTALEEGVFVSAGFGKHKQTGELQTHFQISTWEDRHKHLAVGKDDSFVDVIVIEEEE